MEDLKFYQDKMDKTMEVGRKQKGSFQRNTASIL